MAFKFVVVKRKALLRAFFVFFLSTNVLAIHSKESAYIRPRAIIEQTSQRIEKLFPLSKILVLPKDKEDINISLQIEESYLILEESNIRSLLPESHRDLQILGGKCELLFLDQSFSSQELEESLLGELQKQGKDISKLKITYLGNNILFPSGLEKKWGNFPKELTAGTKIFTLDSWKGNKKIYSTRLKFKVEKKVLVAVTTKKLTRFQLIQKEDYEMKPIYIEEPVRDYVTEEPLGLATLTNVEEGSILRKKHIRLVHAIERGSEVETVYTIGNLTVKGKAIAKNSGNIGEKIEAKSIPNNVLLKGIVKSKGVMEVE
jgi:flagella basal body P-ring formation protein FlgA